MKRVAGLLYGQETHHLDHLAPLCSLMGIPLLISEQKIADLCAIYYPSVKTIYFDYLDIAFRITADFDLLFTCMPRPLFDEIFFLSQKLQGKSLATVWCPHGNSDKGHASALMEGLKEDRTLLVYGKKMIDFLRQKKVFDTFKQFTCIGNYRLHYYTKHKHFYDELIDKLIPPSPGRRTILYAPTWQDGEDSSSFFDACCHLIEQCPDYYTLLVKPHPNLLRQPGTEELIARYQGEKNMRFLLDLSPIYPLLSRVDIYVGDMSSIGYDFLTFDKPMFFLNQNDRDAKTDQGLHLFQAGVEIKQSQYAEIYEMIDSHLPLDGSFSQIRQTLYRDCFGEEKLWHDIQTEIFNLCKTV